MVTSGGVTRHNAKVIVNFRPKYYIGNAQLSFLGSSERVPWLDCSRVDDEICWPIGIVRLRPSRRDYGVRRRFYRLEGKYERTHEGHCKGPGSFGDYHLQGASQSSGHR